MLAGLAAPRKSTNRPYPSADGGCKSAYYLPGFYTLAPVRRISNARVNFGMDALENDAALINMKFGATADL